MSGNPRQRAQSSGLGGYRSKGGEMTESPIPWRVIRAAPDMLAALENILADANGGLMRKSSSKDAHLYFEAIQEYARAAIARAKGEKE
jgi:hypothetical protein